MSKNREEILREMQSAVEAGRDVKDYIIGLANGFPDSEAKPRKIAALIMAYNTYEKGLFDEALLAEAIEKILQ